MTRKSRPCAAVILAAGVGSRLRNVVDGTPKGLIEVADESLVARSVRLLRRQGIERIIIVAGYRAELYHAFAQDHQVEVVDNNDFATSSTLSSLAIALGRTHEDFMLLESDLLYEERALSLLIEHPHPTAVLVSQFTGAGDEVWVEARNGELLHMAKRELRPPEACGEFVGISKVAAADGAALLAMHESCSASTARKMHYEEHGLIWLAQQRRVDVCLAKELLWGEVDDASHYDRITSYLAPSLLKLETPNVEVAPLV